ncbi:MAG: 1-acyl-sn-glycerol-3-phosphate acyltransferase [Balneolales bacterium]
MPYKYINLKEQIEESNSELLKRLPGFLLACLEKIIKQDEINRILANNEGVNGMEFLKNLMQELNITPEVEGLENLPDHSKCFFVANHPYGIADGLILTRIVSQKYGDFRSIGNYLFFLIPPLKPHIAAVNVFGRSKRAYHNELDKVYHSDIPITHFPAGEVSRTKWFRVQDRNWQKSFISKSIECERDIVPIYFFGINSALFHAISILRRFLRIKVNMELALLPYEFFNKRNKILRVRIGRPISYKTFDHNRTHAEWAQWVKLQVYNLRKRRVSAV